MKEIKSQAEIFANKIDRVLRKKGLSFRSNEKIGEMIKNLLPHFPGVEVERIIIFPDQSIITVTSGSFIIS
jgi:hypothetical protein